MSEYIKNFDGWNKRKKLVDGNHTNNLYFKEREIWWASIGVNIGSESDGKNELFERPVLILKKTGSDIFFGAPITSKTKQGPYFAEISYSQRIGTVSVVDVRAMSTKRLLRKIVILEDTEFQKVMSKFKNLIA